MALTSNELISELITVLASFRNLTARQLEARLLARQILVTRSEINSVLYANRRVFSRDGDYRWSLADDRKLRSSAANELRRHLERSLKANPGSTARQLVRSLSDLGLYFSRREVNSALYSGTDLFWNHRLGSSAPTWQVMSGVALVPEREFYKDSRPQPQSPFPLYRWQAEALDSWSTQGHKGVIEAVTGSGKSLIGLAAASRELDDGGKVEILVPGIDLLRQWSSLVRESLPGKSLALMGDGQHGSLDDADILIAIVNSARLASQTKISRSALLIADECHRYASDQNVLALNGYIFSKRLGLTATYGRQDDGDTKYLDPFFGGVCYQFGYSDAIRDEVTAHFKVAFVEVAFDEDEREEYTEADEHARRTRAWLINNTDVRPEPFGTFMADVTWLSEGGHDQETAMARRYLSAFNRRRRILAETTSKINLLNQLGTSIKKAERVIVFTERTNASEHAASVLRRLGIKSAAVHSGIDKADRHDLLAQFARGSMKVLCAPRILDEGIDIPDADLGIVLAASQNPRQMIQRMGRLLRRKRDGRYARFLITFVGGTSEDPSHGAHGTFIENLVDGADVIQNYSAEEDAVSINNFLNNYRWGGDIPKPKMA